MGIKVKHSPSAAALGGSAYTIGRGQKRRWEAEFGLKQLSLGLQAASIGANARARRDALEQREKESERLHGLREDELEFRQEQWQDREEQQQEEMGLRLQARLDAKEIYDKEHTVTDYTPKQLKKLEHYDNLQATAEQEFAEGKWTAVQLEEITRKNNHLKDLVIPQTRLMTEMTPKQLLESKFVIRNGIEYMEKANGDWEQTGAKFTEKAKLYTDIFKVMDARQDTDGNAIPIDEHELDKRFLNALTRFRQIDELASRVEEEQKRRAQRGPQPSLEQEAQRKAAVEALPVMFDTIVKGQPKIGRKKKGKTSSDKVYGEEAYNKMLMEAIGRGEKEGIPPDVVKAELDKWWDSQYDKERGQMFQKFGDRTKFKPAAEQQVSVLAKGLEKSLNLSPKAALRVAKKKLAYEAEQQSARKAAPAKREVVPEVDLEKLDEFSLNRIKTFKSGKIVWSAIRKKYGQETADELKYIVGSGNEQAIANALRRLGII